MTPDAAHSFDGLREPWLHDPRCREAHGPERTVFPCAWHARPGEHYLDEETAEVRSGLTGGVVFRVRADAVPHARYVEMGTMGVAAPRLVDTETGEILHHEAVHAAIPRPGEPQLDLLERLLLTKRPENVERLMPDRWPELNYQPAFDEEWNVGWPRNIWLGTTVEDQQRADERVPVLLSLPAAVRFLSCEPLLGPVSLDRWLGIEWMDALRPPGAPLSFRGEGGWGAEMFATLRGDAPRVQWVITGGESGPGHRPMNLNHARDLRDQCAAAGVAFFFKQVGGRTPTAGGKLLDGVEYCAFPERVA